MRNLLLLLVFICAASCKGQDCETLPKKYSSYSEALSIITNASFNYTDTVDTSKSSWVKGAKYYSCDNVQGFLIIKTKSKNYIHKNVPLKIWITFKKASSFGTYYNSKIKGKYQIHIN